MISYLLLRSNKESGPYSLEELVDLGLKAYDLVWVKGKSAAWRYPSEIDELKPYAPAVEEQPFDRFYRKNTEEVKEVITAQPVVPQPVASKPDQVTAYQPKLEKKETPAYIPKKSVAVTLPGQRTVISKQPVKPQTPVSPAPVPLEAEAIPTVSISENPVTPQVKFSQPLDDIKEMYVKTLHERKSKIARKGLVKIGLQRAAVIVGLIGIGILAGFIIKPKSTGAASLVDNTISSPSLSKEIANPVPDTAVPESQPETQEPEALMPVAPEQVKITPEEKAIATVKNRDLPFQKQPSAGEEKKQPSQSSLPEEQPGKETYGYTGSVQNPQSGERSRTIRSSEPDTRISTPEPEKRASKSAKRSELDDQVTVSSNDYKKVAFGGIRDLRLTVTNNSRFELDNVIVELQYLKPSEEPLRTEHIRFKGVLPNESSTIKIPDTNRGIKVNYRILTIDSKKSREEVAGK